LEQLSGEFTQQKPIADGGDCIHQWPIVPLASPARRTQVVNRTASAYRKPFSSAPSFQR
jgi:hypothetical protein